jgi:hypothetical protein
MSNMYRNSTGSSTDRRTSISLRMAVTHCRMVKGKRAKAPALDLLWT